MNSQLVTDAKRESVLAREFTKRITQLGMSRRELVKRSGLSRQTLHNVEREGRTELKPATLRALDQALYWAPGTALALSKGDASVLVDADAMGHAEREAAFRWRIVEKVQRMTLEDLERMVSLMDGESLGDDESGISTAQIVDLVSARVLQQITGNNNRSKGNNEL